MHLEKDNGRIYYEDQGSGEAVVLLHGFTESSLIWHDFKKYLASGFRVILIDLPGHGKSSTFGSVHSMEFMAECVHDVLLSLNIHCSVMIGHSMGGYVALAYARSFGKNLKGLGLFHSTSLADTEETKHARDKAIEAIKNNHSRFLLNFIPSLFAPETKDLYQDEIQTLIDEASLMSAEAIIAAQEGMKKRVSSLDILINAHFPVMFIAGQKDARVPFENIWVQMALTETTHALILRNAGHMGYIESKIQSLDFTESFARACYKI